MYVAIGKKVEEIEVQGKKCVYQFAIKGPDLHLGSGKIEILSRVGIEHPDSTWEYVKDPQPFYEVQDTRAIMSHPFPDGLGGTVLGIQVFKAICAMTDMVWDGTILPDGSFKPEQVPGETSIEETPIEEEPVGETGVGE